MSYEKHAAWWHTLDADRRPLRRQLFRMFIALKGVETKAAMIDAGLASIDQAEIYTLPLDTEEQLAAVYAAFEAWLDDVKEELNRGD